MLRVISASPAAPPRGAWWPWPLSRICWPSASPAGILTATSLPVGRGTAPEPPRTLGIDVAAVERFALVLLAEDFISGGDLGELHRRLGVVLVGVGMQPLGEPPVGFLDFVLARRPRHPQNLVGVAHPAFAPKCRLDCRATRVNVVHVLPRCNGNRTTDGQAIAPVRALGLFQRPQAFDFPLALVDSAGLALHPGFASLAHVARQELVADEPVLGVGRGDRGDRAARSAAR